MKHRIARCLRSMADRLDGGGAARLPLRYTGIAERIERREVAYVPGEGWFVWDADARQWVRDDAPQGWDVLWDRVLPIPFDAGGNCEGQEAAE